MPRRRDVDGASWIDVTCPKWYSILRTLNDYVATHRNGRFRPLCIVLNYA